MNRTLGFALWSIVSTLLSLAFLSTAELLPASVTWVLYSIILIYMSIFISIFRWLCSCSRSVSSQQMWLTTVFCGDTSSQMKQSWTSGGQYSLLTASVDVWSRSRSRKLRDVVPVKCRCSPSMSPSVSLNWTELNWSSSCLCFQLICSALWQQWTFPRHKKHNKHICLLGSQLKFSSFFVTKWFYC